MLKCIYLFTQVIYVVLKSCLICLNSRREKSLWIHVDSNFPPILTKGILKPGEGVLGVWGDSGYIERLLLNNKTPGFLASRGDEFKPGPEMRLDSSELLCNKVLLKYKGDRESF